MSVSIMHTRYCTSLAEVPAAAWNRLSDGSNPFLQHEFLLALEQHQCLEPYGWQALHVLVEDEQQQLIGALPLYAKGNSYGEFVFDWSWASAYEQVVRKPYYPKLVSALPYTPATGDRLLVAPEADAIAVQQQLHDAALQMAQRINASSLHYLFTSETDNVFLQSQAKLHPRIGYQFHWQNEGYRDFQDFLDRFTSKKRKQIRRERRDAQSAGLSIECLNGHQATEEHWQIYHQFYCSTFDRKSGVPTLSLAFFQALAQTMPDQVLLVLAHQNGQYVAGAFNLCGTDTLYGRHWGCNAHFRHLHFELCYYQTLDYCLARGLQRFEAGAQGEHKLSRGFLPTVTWSWHWLNDEPFAALVQRFLQQETPAIRSYVAELETHSPFKED